MNILGENENPIIWKKNILDALKDLSECNECIGFQNIFSNTHYW